MIDLYDYQRAAVDALCAATRGILVAPARSGKTVMMAAALARAAGANPTVVHAGMRVRDAGANRQQIINQFRDGRIKTLIATSLADEGFDAPIVDCMMNAAAGRGMSQMLCSVTGQRRASSRFVQRSSRALTATPTKTCAEIHDFWDWHHPMLMAHAASRRRGCMEMSMTVRMAS